MFTENFYDTTDGSIVNTKSFISITQSAIDRQVNVNPRDVDLIALDEIRP